MNEVKLTPIQVNALLKRKASLERKLIFMKTGKSFMYEIKVTDKNKDRISLHFKRYHSDSMEKRVINELKQQLKLVNLDLGIIK